MGRLWRVATLSIWTISVTLTWGAPPGPEVDRLVGRGPLEIELTETDAQLEDLLKSQNGSKERFADLFRFGLMNRPLIGEVHLGAFGELLGPPHKGPTSPASLVTFRYRGGLVLVAYSEYPELGLERGTQYAKVERDGAITYFVSDEDVAADLSSSPDRWPLSLEHGFPRNLEQGEILQRPTPNWGTDCDPPPEGSTGWAFMGLYGTLILPLPGDPRPDNVVWVVPKREGGFDLIWGGPRRRGLLMSVAKSCEVTLGDDSPYRLETRGGGRWSWVFKDDHGAVMIPSGHSVYPLEDSGPVSTSYFLTESGDIVTQTTRTF